MIIRVNGDSVNLQESCSLEFLIREVKLSDRNGIAVAVNGMVVQKKAWPDHLLNESDEVIIIEAAQGG